MALCSSVAARSLLQQCAGVLSATAVLASEQLQAPVTHWDLPWQFCAVSDGQTWNASCSSPTQISTRTLTLTLYLTLTVTWS